MIAISVSTNYEDLLSIVLPQNYKFFDKWYIITCPDDEKTIEVVNTANYSNVELLYFDFFANIQPSGIKPTFNKGGAIRMCQEKLIAEGYTGPVLLLDSDIYLPDILESLLESMTISENTLYGSFLRRDYYSKEKFLARTPDCNYPWPEEIHGYFQLYKQSPSLLYNNSRNCSTCDIEFISKFSNKTIIRELIVDHLGKPGVNWNMRVSRDDFRDGSCSITNYLNERGFHQFEGYSQQVPEQVKDLIRLSSGSGIHVMEIGFSAGHSAEIFLQNNPTLTLTSFDLGGHPYVTTAKKYIDATYPNRHTLILGDSTVTVPKYSNDNPDKTFDLIFIDGGHDYRIVNADLENCRKMANKDTIVIIDDTMYRSGWEKAWTVGPTQTWVEHLNNHTITEISRVAYCPGRGMSWGKYVF